MDKIYYTNAYKSFSLNYNGDYRNLFLYTDIIKSEAYGPATPNILTHYFDFLDLQEKIISPETHSILYKTYLSEVSEYIKNLSNNCSFKYDSEEYTLDSDECALNIVLLKMREGDLHGVIKK